jgi:bacterioferritin
LEYDAVKRLNDGIATCVAAGDNGSRELLEEILTDEEEHIDWLEGQLHSIGEMGIENYLAQQLHEDKSS